MTVTVTARRPRGAPLLLGLLLLALGACTAPQEQALSALHYFQRGNAAFQAEDFGRAIEHYRMALSFDADAPDIHYNLGLAYYRVGDYAAAVPAYQEALRLDPGFAEAHLNLALAFNKLYNAGAAHMHYNRYRELVMGNRSGAPAGGVAANSAGAGGQTAARASVGGLPPGLPGGAAPQAARQAVGAMPVGGNALAPGRPAANSGAQAAAPAAQSAPNPFQGNSKWWTQETANPNR